MNSGPVKINNTLAGEGQPVYIIAELGINHNGSLDIAKELIVVAVESGCGQQARLPRALFVHPA